MQKLSALKSLFILSSLLVLFVATTHADSGPAEYAVNGQITIAGNNCGSSPCTETMQFSFDFGFTQEYPAEGGYAPGYIGSVEGPVTISSTGPLGSFGSGGCCVTSDYLALTNGVGDEIDLEVDLGSVFQQTFGVPGPPVFLGSDLYSCFSTTCVNDFLPPGSPQQGLYLSGTLDYTATLVPEPSAFSLVCFGLVGLGLLRAGRRRTLVLPASN